MNPAVTSLIIFAIMIILWIIDRLPMAYVSMAGCVVCVLLGISTLPRAMTGFTQDLIYLVAGMDIVGLALMNSGLAHVVGRAVLKLAKNNEKRLMIISFFIAAAMSAFMSNMTVVVFFLVIFKGVTQSSKAFTMKNIALPAIYGSVVGGVCTLVGSTPQLIGQNIIENMGVQGFKMFEFAPIGIPIVVVTGLAIYVYAYGHGKKVWVKSLARTTDNDSTSILMNAAVENGGIDFSQDVIDKKKLYTMSVITALLVIMLVSEVVTVGTAAITAALLSIAFGCISQKQAFSEMNWNVIIWLGGCFSMAEILTASGGMALVTSALSSLVTADTPPFLFFALVTLICMVVSQFTSNTACVLLFMPIFLPMAQAMGISPEAIAMGVIYGSSLAVLTPLASAQIGMAITVGFNFKEIVRYGILLHIVMYLAAIIMIPLRFPL
ncbi:MAG: SLC13 family permease [Oscillospiraceae bacterium]|nr:SLC13 family permease [Oscillospiraceae bacterium]